MCDECWQEEFIDSRFLVRVYLLSGKDFNVWSRSNETVIVFKSRLAQETQMDYFAQRLFDEKKNELSNNQTMSEASVDSSSLLMCVLDDDQPPPLTSSDSESDTEESDPEEKVFFTDLLDRIGHPDWTCTRKKSSD